MSRGRFFGMLISNLEEFFDYTPLGACTVVWEGRGVKKGIFFFLGKYYHVGYTKVGFLVCCRFFGITSLGLVYKEGGGRVMVAFTHLANTIISILLQDVVVHVHYRLFLLFQQSYKKMKVLRYSK